MTPVTVLVPESKLVFFKELVHSLHFKEFESSEDIFISEKQKELVLNRIKESKPENLLKWDEIKDSFNFE